MSSPTYSFSRVIKAYVGKESKMFFKVFALVFLCALSIGYTDAKKSTVAVPADIVGLITEKSVECVAETGADVNILQRVFNWQFDNNKTSKKFSFCLFKKAGFSDDTGHFHKEKILALYEKSGKKELVRDAAIDCDKINEKNPVETMYKVILCFFEKSPVLLEVKLD